MVAFEQCSSPPQFKVELAGHVTLEEVEAHLQAFEDAVTRVQPGFMLLSDRLELESIEPGVAGVFSYYAGQILRAKPKAIIVIYRAPLQPIENYMKRVDHHRVLHYVESREEADLLIQQLGASVEANDPEMR